MHYRFIHINSIAQIQRLLEWQWFQTCKPKIDKKYWQKEFNKLQRRYKTEMSKRISSIYTELSTIVSSKQSRIYTIWINKHWSI